MVKKISLTLTFLESKKQVSKISLEGKIIIIKL
jgi:hypothetical protein